MLEDNGRCLGAGAYPCKHPINGAVAAIGRQLHATSVRTGRIGTFRKVGKYLVERVIGEIENMIGMRDMPMDIDRSLFNSILSHLPIAKRDQMWEDFDQSKLGRTPKTYRQAKTFVKAEDSAKPGGTVKPRAITVMPTEMYIEAFPSLIAQHYIYSCPLIYQWMTKGKTPDEVYDTVRPILDQEHRSQDISGFEKAMTVEMRVVEIELVTRVLTILGMGGSSDYVQQVMTAERKIRTDYYSYSLGVRCSGDFWTSLGNGLANIVIILTGHYVKSGCPKDMDTWWLTARELTFVTEGDDALLPQHIASVDTTMELMMELSLATPSDRIGGADFLKNTFYPIFDKSGHHVGKLGNTLRWCRSLMHVRGEKLRPGKIRFLWRAKALSLLHLAPNHPIINPLCYRIDELTQGVRWFKGAEQLSRKWGMLWSTLGDVTKPFPRGPQYQINTDLRTALANSPCPELPPVSVDAQLHLEQSFKVWTPGVGIQIPVEWRAYPEYDSAIAGNSLESRPCVGAFKDPVVELLWEYMLQSRC